MKRKRRVREGNFEPHPADREGVSLLRGTRAYFTLNPKGLIWDILAGPTFGDQHVSVLEKFPNLISFTKGTTFRAEENLTDLGLKRIVGIPNISVLMLTNLPNITDSVTPDLASSQIRWLSLNCLAITDSGIPAISTMTGLLKLCLYKSSITDVSLQKLRRLVNLRRLNLHGCNVSDAAVDVLKRQLPRCDIVSDRAAG